MSNVTLTHRWPCAACGSDMRYAPGTLHLVCDHCSAVQDILPSSAGDRSQALREIDLAKGLADDLPAQATQDVRSTSCPNCGAVVTFLGSSHAAECAYCATPVVVDTGDQRRIKPTTVLPFALSEMAARAALIKWLGSLWFAPNGLLQYTRKHRAMAGIYVPFWTFDAQTVTRYTGQRGEHYYETRMVMVNVNGRSEQRSQKVQRTRWYPAAGTVSRGFDDVIALASKSLPSRLGDELTPWDLGQLVPYNPDYLAGFQAEGYSVTLAEGHTNARNKMQAVIVMDVNRDIGGDVQRIITMNTRYSDETFKHVLLPIWTAAYKYRGRSFRFLVNGQTGEVQGERPYSAWKIAFAVIAVAGIALGAIYLNDPTALGLPRPSWMN